MLNANTENLWKIYHTSKDHSVKEKIIENYNQILNEINKYSPYPEKVKILFVKNMESSNKKLGLIKMVVVVLNVITNLYQKN